MRSIEIAVDGRPAGRRIDPKDYGNGPHRVTITATDRAGNITTEQADIRFTHAEAEPRAMLALKGRPATGHTVANVGDADGDGREDILAGATLIRSNGDPVRFRGAEIVAVAAGGDVNGDGYRDPLLASRDTVYAVFGGPDLQELRPAPPRPPRLERSAPRPPRWPRGGSATSRSTATSTATASTTSRSPAAAACPWSAGAVAAGPLAPTAASTCRPARSRSPATSTTTAAPSC